MRITVDGVELPVGCRVNLSTGQQPFISVQLPISSPSRNVLLALADGNVHKFEWWTDDETPTKYAEAHAKLVARLTVQVGGSGQDFIEVSGEAWGPPPNYSQFFLFDT